MEEYSYFLLHVLPGTPASLPGETRVHTHLFQPHLMHSALLMWPLLHRRDRALRGRPYRQTLALCPLSWSSHSLPILTLLTIPILTVLFLFSSVARVKPHTNSRNYTSYSSYMNLLQFEVIPSYTPLSFLLTQVRIHFSHHLPPTAVTQLLSPPPTLISHPSSLSPIFHLCLSFFSPPPSRFTHIAPSCFTIHSSSFLI